MYRYIRNIIRCLVEMHEVEPVLQPAYGQAGQVADQESAPDQEGGSVEKHFSYRTVIRSQRLQRADHLHTFQDNDKQRGDHVDAGYGNHQGDDDGCIYILKAQPVEDLGVNFLDAAGIPVITYRTVNVLCRLVEIVKVIDGYF